MNRKDFELSGIVDIVVDCCKSAVYSDTAITKEGLLGSSKNDNGNRIHKHHQFLTSEVGRPALKQHLAILHSFALASDYNWGRFMSLLDKSHPKKYQQLALFDDFDFE